MIPSSFSGKILRTEEYSLDKILNFYETGGRHKKLARNTILVAHIDILPSDLLIMALLKLEDLANEILLDTFDYLRPLDLIRAFHLLNERFRTLLIHRRLHVNLSTNLSFNDYHEYCLQIFPCYCLTIHSIYLSNVETCGAISLFFRHFPQSEITFPSLRAMSFIEANKNDYEHIKQLKHITSVHLQCKKMFEQQIQPAKLFDNPHLQTCILSYDDTLPISKLRSSTSLKRLVLDNFYINDLHILFYCYPSLEHLTIHRLSVNFQGFLPPFYAPIETLHTLKLNCVYTVRSDYIAHVLSFLPRLRRLTAIAIGMDFLTSEHWREVLTSMDQLRFLVLDLKAVSETFDNELASSFLTGYWGPWRIAVDYSEDNKKFHLFNVPCRRSSFISTIHNVHVVNAPGHVFDAVTHLYLKKNGPVQLCAERRYPNVRALQIYQNAVTTEDDSAFLTRICSMLHLHKLVHLELFSSMLPAAFLTLIKSIPCLRYFKTDYDVLLSLTDSLQDDGVCMELHRKLDKLVLRRGALPMAVNDRFLHIFSNVKHLQINLRTIEDLRQIACKFVKNMSNLLTLHICLIDADESMDSLLWEGIVNNISYEIAKRHIKIWK